MKRLLNTWRDTDPSDSKKRPVSAAFFSKPSRELVVANNNVVYSSSSSDGSVVHTPEPDDLPQTSRWSSWVKSMSSKPKSTTTHVASVWQLPGPSPSSTPQPKHRQRLESDDGDDDDDDEDDSDHYGDENEVAPKITPVPQRVTSRITLQPATINRAQRNLRAITLAALVPPQSLPPFLHLPPAPLFPRSSNKSRKLVTLQTTRSVLLRSSLVRRLEARNLSRSENVSITQFGDRPRNAVPKSRPARPSIDEEAVSDVNKKLRNYSQGLQAWLDRPPFEERCVLWTWDAQGQEVVMRGVIGSGKAIASLEFTEGIEALAYDAEPVTVQAPKKAPTLQPLITSLPTRKCAQATVMQREGTSSAASTPNASTGPSTPTTHNPPFGTPCKILRFALDPGPGADPDDDDDIPLGFQVRGGRHVEDVNRKAEEQAQQQERMRKLLAREVKATRARREGARSGMMHNVEIERNQDRRQNYTRPVYDPSPSPRKTMPEPDSRMLYKVPAVWGTSSSQSLTPTSIPPSVPVSSQTLSRSSTMLGLEEEKKRRRASVVSEGAVSTSASSIRHRHKLPPSALPTQFISMGQPVPSMPVTPMYPVVPGTPQYFLMQSQAQSQTPLRPPAKPWLAQSRSMEGLSRDASVPRSVQHHSSSAGGSTHSTHRRSTAAGVR